MMHVDMSMVVAIDLVERVSTISLENCVHLFLVKVNCPVFDNLSLFCHQLIVLRRSSLTDSGLHPMVTETAPPGACDV